MTEERRESRARGGGAREREGEGGREGEERRGMERQRVPEGG